MARTNASVLGEIDVKRELIGNMMPVKKGYFGHIMRDSGSPLTKQIVKRMVEGKRKRERQKKHLYDNFRKWSGLCCTKAKHKAQDRTP